VREAAVGLRRVAVVSLVAADALGEYAADERVLRFNR
jgi:hypothetical protein